MPLLDDDVKELVSRLRLAYVATVCPDGTANLSPKGSLAVWDDTHLIFLDIASPQTMENLAANPSIEINLVDPFARRGYRVKGRGVVKTSGPEFDFSANQLRERYGDLYPTNGVVVIEVERVRPVLSPNYMFDSEAAEESITEEWMAFYKVRPVKPGKGR